MAKTIEEIAIALGISVTTVRLVLLGKARQYRISDKTAERVSQYTQQHGYHLNHTARSLRLQRTDSLALIVPRLSNHFFALLAERLEIRCREAGLQLFISCCYDNPDTQMQLIRNFHQRNIDGLFVVPCNPQIPAQVAPLFDGRLVLLDRDFGLPEYPVVVTANEQSSRELSLRLYEYAQQKLHSGQPQHAKPKLLLLAGNPAMPSIAGRVKGFHQALASLGASASQVQVREAPRNGFTEGLEVMSTYLQEGNPLPDVLIASSIALFEGALQGLRNRCGQVPPQLILATFDDHTMLDFLPNPLFSVQQDYPYIIDSAFAAMEQLLHKDQEQPKEQPGARYIAQMHIISRNT